MALFVSFAYFNGNAGCEVSGPQPAILLVYAFHAWGDPRSRRHPSASRRFRSASFCSWCGLRPTRMTNPFNRGGAPGRAHISAKSRRSFSPASIPAKPRAPRMPPASRSSGTSSSGLAARIGFPRRVNPNPLQQCRGFGACPHSRQPGLGGPFWFAKVATARQLGCCRDRRR